jgi:hypothetical protein
MTLPLGYTDLETANLALSSRGVPVGTAKQLLVKWDPDIPEASTESFMIVLGPDDAGHLARKKWWRGITLHGAGTARVLFFNIITLGHAVFVKEGVITMEDTSANLINTLWVPRGTKGYFALVVLMVNGRLDDADLLFDLVGAVEDK